MRNTHNIFTKIFFPIIVVLISLSCDDEAFFDEEKLIATQLTDPINSTAKLDEVVNGTYWMMIGPQETGTGNPYDVMRTWNSLASDAFGPTDPPTLDFLNDLDGAYLYNRTNNHILGNGPERAWRICYSNISNLNLVIEAYEEALPGVPFDDELVDQLPRIVGEAYFLRGYHLWIVHQMFGPTFDPSGDNSALSVIIKERNSQGLKETNVSQSTVDQVYQAMIADFDSAVANLPNTIKVGRAAKSAAETMLARIYLEINDFQMAEQYAANVINNYGFSLETQPIEAFNNGGVEESNEVIWSYLWAVGQGHQFPRVGFITPIPSSHFQWVERRSFGFAGAVDTQFRTYALSKSILQKIGWMDANFNETASAANDLRYQQVYQRAEIDEDFRLENFIADGSFNSPNVWVFKDCRDASNDEIAAAIALDPENVSEFDDDFFNPNVQYPLMRLSEMYLTRSIARLRQGNEAGALEDLNVTRQRAWDASAGAYVPISATNLAGASSVEEAIEIERIKELSGEGDRLYYLRAMKMQVPSGDRSGGDISFNDPSIVWTLPPSERDLNEAVD